MLDGLRGLPDELQTLLLRAALLDGDDALRAYSAWSPHIDLAKDVDGGTFRMLPLAYINLTRLGVRDPMLQRMKSVYRYAWADQQGQLQFASEMGARIQAIGVPVLASKGIVLATAFYDSPALRPMSDIDFAVSRENLPATLKLLRGSGWRPEYNLDDPEFYDWFVRREHAIAMYHGKRQLDLHWQLFQECLSHRTNALIWAAAVPLPLSTVTLLRPCTPDLFLQACIHGLRPNPMPSFRWIADAVMILRKEGRAFDWDLLVDRARAVHVPWRLHFALTLLRRDFNQDIPEAVFSALQRGSRSWIERAEFDDALNRRSVMGERLALAGRLARGGRAGDVLLLARDFVRHRLPSRKLA